MCGNISFSLYDDDKCKGKIDQAMSDYFNKMYSKEVVEAIIFVISVTVAVSFEEAGPILV